jgi:hypothetical protein
VRIVGRRFRVPAGSECVSARSGDLVGDAHGGSAQGDCLISYMGAPEGLKVCSWAAAGEK